MAPVAGRTWGRRIVAAVVLGAIVAPAVIDRDSFPLSTYPMYADTRGEVVSLPIAVGLDAGGARRTLSLATIAQTDDPLIAVALLSQAVAGGETGALCEEIADRAPAGIVAIEIADEEHDVIERAAGGDSLVSRTVRARCEVSG